MYKNCNFIFSIIVLNFFSKCSYCQDGKTLILVNSASLPILKGLCGATMPRNHLCCHHLSCWHRWKPPNSPVVFHYGSMHICYALLVLPHRLLPRLALYHKQAIIWPPRTFMCPCPPRVPGKQMPFLSCLPGPWAVCLPPTPHWAWGIRTSLTIQQLQNHYPGNGGLGSDRSPLLKNL